MRISRITLAAVMAVMSVSFAPAYAEPAAAPSPSVVTGDRYNRVVDIRNDTNTTVYRFYISNSATNDWGPDLLGTNTLSPMGVVSRYNVDDGTGQCVFDFRAEFSGGEVRTGMRINVCSVRYISIRPEGVVGYN